MGFKCFFVPTLFQNFWMYIGLCWNVDICHRVCVLYKKTKQKTNKKDGSRKLIFRYLTGRRQILAHYCDCFILYQRQMQLTWQTASLSKVLHSLHDTVWMYEKKEKKRKTKGQGLGILLNCEFISVWVQLSTEGASTHTDIILLFL